MYDYVHSLLYNIPICDMAHTTAVTVYTEKLAHLFVKSLKEPQFRSRILANSVPLTNGTISSSTTSTVTSNLKRFFFIVTVDTSSWSKR